MADDLQARDIMTDGVIAIDKNTSVKDASRKMHDEHIRSLVVLDSGEAVGIVVGRDLVYKVIATGRDPEDTTVEDIMTTELITADESDAVEDIARSLMEHDISRVPILRGNQLVGIVTQSNIVRAWPSYIDLLREENQLYPVGSSGNEVSVLAGECDNCGNYSEELVSIDGSFFCPECRAEL